MNCAFFMSSQSSWSKSSVRIAVRLAAEGSESGIWFIFPFISSFSLPSSMTLSHHSYTLLLIQCLRRASRVCHALSEASIAHSCCVIDSTIILPEAWCDGFRLFRCVVPLCSEESSAPVLPLTTTSLPMATGGRLNDDNWADVRATSPKAARAVCGEICLWSRINWNREQASTQSRHFELL